MDMGEEGTGDKVESTESVWDEMVNAEDRVDVEAKDWVLVLLARVLVLDG